MFQQAELDKDIWFGILETIQETMTALIIEEGRIPEPVVEPMIEQWVNGKRSVVSPSLVNACLLPLV